MALPDSVSMLVGELYFDFADFNTGEMTYLVDGLLQFKNITKQKF